MRQAEQVRVLKELMGRLRDGVNVDAGGIRRNPISAYTCEDRAAREWDVLFRKHPQIVGLSGDLPKPGTFFTRNDFGLPVLCTRDTSGQFRAFANVCRHRGAIVETGKSGEKTRFSCPFHAWTYANTGELIGLPKHDQFGAVDPKCLGLVELPAEEKWGLLWVHPQKDGAFSVDELLGDLGDEFESWGFDRLVLTGDETYETPMNWKLAVDTFGETYHFSALHQNTLFPFFHGNVQCYDTYKRNHRMALCIRTIDALPGVPEADWHISDGAFPVYFLFPNIQLNVGRNGVVLVRIYPSETNPRLSLSRISFYAWPEALAALGAEAMGLNQGFADIIRDEDYVAAAACQIGADSGIQDHVIFGRNEPALHHYHNTYRDALGLEPLPLIKA